MKVRIFFFLTVICAPTVHCHEHKSESTNLREDKPKVFYANFEEGSLDNWSYLLNPQGIEIISAADAAKDNQHIIYAGHHSAKITIKGTDDFLWNGADSLNRSELQHATSSSVESGSTHISFAFMLPKLFTDTRHEFAYWETNQSYQQIMRFNLRADTMSFQMSNASPLWSFKQLQAGIWYKVDMQIHWSSKEPNTQIQQNQSGSVKIWLDDQLVVNETNIKTLIASERAIFQIGILRDKQALAESVYLDEIIEYQTGAD